ncbi:MAG: hypothetical protein R3E53_20600, partial [Myxococcota bacterium]
MARALISGPRAPDPVGTASVGRVVSSQPEADREDSEQACGADPKPSTERRQGGREEDARMYESFFGLRELPFSLTPDPRFL